MPLAPDPTATAPRLGTKGEVRIEGVDVERDAAGAVDLVYYAGRVRNVAPYRGPLPHGLSWSMTATQALASVGREASKDCCTFHDLGVQLHFAGRCLGAVSTFEAVPRGTARVRSLRVTESGTDTKGIAIDRHVFGASDDLAVEVAIVDGQDRELLRTEETFVPYVALPLPPGPHVLTAIVHGKEATTTGDRTHTFEIEMPRRWEIRVGVREVRVEGFDDEDGITRAVRRGAAAAVERTQPLRPAKFERSDPRWKLVYNRRFVHTSRTRKDTRRARWRRRAPWMVVSGVDTVRIDVEDVDLVFHDDLGSFVFSVEELVAGKALTAQRGGTSIRLMKTQVRALRR